MSNISEILFSLTNKFSVIPWQDYGEVLIFSSLIYSFLSWLKKDIQKNLTYPFYVYCILFCGSYYVQLSTVHAILLSGAPLALMLFIVLHQETLQRNFVMFKRAQKPQEFSSHWIDELMRGSLTALNNNKELVIVVERNDNLKNILYAPCLFYADLKKDIFDILIEKHICTNDYLVWVTQEGKLVAINAAWRINLDEEWITQEAQALHKWKQDAIFVSSKTDAIIFKVNVLSRTFNLVMQGKIAEEISSEQLLAILQRNILGTKIRGSEPAVSLVAEKSQEKVI